MAVEGANDVEDIMALSHYRSPVAQQFIVRLTYTREMQIAVAISRSSSCRQYLLVHNINCYRLTLIPIMLAAGQQPEKGNANHISR